MILDRIVVTLFGGWEQLLMSEQRRMHGDVRSVLKMDNVVFDRISFERHGFLQKEDADIEFQMGTHIVQDALGKYRVILKVTAEKAEEYTVEVQITGYCEIDECCPDKDVLLKKNAVAILFPYVRAELSLLTAQPGTEPIVLPVVNIAAMMDQAEAID